MQVRQPAASHSGISSLTFSGAVYLCFTQSSVTFYCKDKADAVDLIYLCGRITEQESAT